MLRIRLARLAALLVAFCLAAGPAEAKKLALLIGNAAYEHTGRLRSPVNDTAAMAERLTRLGYAVTRLTDADRRSMGRAIKAFARQARGADTALVYYSGHGMELSGRNYLAPVDAELAYPDDAGIEAIALEDVVAAAAGATRLSVVILDACRNNSFPTAQKSGAKGFVAVGARPGQVIAFATAPGQVAMDGGGELSPYTRALTDALDRTPEVDVRRLFTSLGAATRQYAGAEQTPFTRFGDMPLEDLSLAGGASPPPQPAKPAAPPRESAYAGSALERLLGGPTSGPPPPPKREPGAPSSAVAALERTLDRTSANWILGFWTKSASCNLGWSERYEFILKDGAPHWRLTSTFSADKTPVPVVYDRKSGFWTSIGFWSKGPDPQYRFERSGEALKVTYLKEKAACVFNRAAQ